MCLGAEMEMVAENQRQSIGSWRGTGKAARYVSTGEWREKMGASKQASWSRAMAHMAEENRG